MSIMQEELDELTQNASTIATAKTNIANAITAKGGTVSPGDGLLDFANDIANIPTPTLTGFNKLVINPNVTVAIIGYYTNSPTVIVALEVNRYDPVTPQGFVKLGTVDGSREPE